jgi:beta-glucosidase
MTQAERGSVSTADVTNFRLRSLLSGGSGAQQHATSWANMYDGFRTRRWRPRCASRDLRRGRGARAQQRGGRDDLPAQHRARRHRDRRSSADRPGGGREVSGTGIDWDFAPCLCVARNDRGAVRTVVRRDPDRYLAGHHRHRAADRRPSMLATAKHYLGDGGTTNGTDQGNTQVSE